MQNIIKENSIKLKNSGKKINWKFNYIFSKKNSLKI